MMTRGEREFEIDLGGGARHLLALCHSGIFTVEAEMPLLNGELRPVLAA